MSTMKHTLTIVVAMVCSAMYTANAAPVEQQTVVSTDDSASVQYSLAKLRGQAYKATNTVTQTKVMVKDTARTAQTAQTKSVQTVNKTKVDTDQSAAWALTAKGLERDLAAKGAVNLTAKSAMPTANALDASISQGTHLSLPVGQVNLSSGTNIGGFVDTDHAMMRTNTGTQTSGNAQINLP